MEICNHYPQCGGCAFNGVDFNEERAIKLEIFQKSGIQIPQGDFAQVPLNSRRRASLTARRTKKSTQIGFVEARTHNVVDIHECHVITPQILALKPFIATITPQVASRTAQLKFHITQCTNGFDIVVDNAKEITPQQRQTIAALCPEYNIRRLIFNDEPIYFDTPPLVEMAGMQIEIPPHPFLQASKECENILQEWAHDAVKGSKKVADLFCGLGTFSFGLNAEVDGYEGSQNLVDLLQKNADRLQLHHIKGHIRDLFRDPLTPKELAQYDAAIIDPPRAGAKAQCEMLANSEISRIAYISCDPVTFARDAAILQSGGYTADEVHLVDQFRFSNHLELFALFRKST